MQDRELNLVSFVATIDPRGSDFKSPAVDISSLETLLKTTVEVEAILTDSGPAKVARLRKQRLDVAFLPLRIEVHSKEGQLDVSTAETISDVASKVMGLFQDGFWKLLGYSFVYVMDAGQQAVKVIGNALLCTDQLSKRVGYDVIGGSASVWMKAGDATLWLRVEPRGMDRGTNRIWINSNFTSETSGNAPSRDVIKESILKKHSELEHILGKVELW